MCTFEAPLHYLCAFIYSLFSLSNGISSRGLLPLQRPKDAAQDLFCKLKHVHKPPPVADEEVTCFSPQAHSGVGLRNFSVQKYHPRRPLTFLCMSAAIHLNVDPSQRV